MIDSCTSSLAALAGYSSSEEVSGCFVIDLFNPRSFAKFESFLRTGDFGQTVQCTLFSGAQGSGRVVVSIAETTMCGDPDLLTLLCVPVFDQSETIHRLESEREVLLRQNRRLTEFSTLLSHDLRGSLHALRGDLDLLQHCLPTEVNSDCRAQLDRLQRTAALMNRVLDNVTQLLRVREGSYPVDLVDMNALVDELARETLEQRTVGVQIQRVNELPTLMGREALIRQLLRNLIENSIKYRRDSPLKITIGFVQDGRPSFYVEDNGVGIHEDDLERVLLPLTRADRDGLHRQGTGMGLTFVAAIVERHSGHVCVESVRGQGTKIWFSLSLYGEEQSKL